MEVEGVNLTKCSLVKLHFFQQDERRRSGKTIHIITLNLDLIILRALK